MKFQPVDEKEYAMRNVWPKGTYACTIVKCEDGNSKTTGHAMFTCTVHVFNEQGSYRIVTARVMGEGNAAWQLRSAAEAFNVLESYRMGTLNAHDLEGKSAYAKVGIEEDENGIYEPKNIIREFTHKAPKTPSAVNVPVGKSVSAGEDFANQDIPF